MFTKKIHLFLTVWLLLIIPIINISLYLLFYKITIDNELERLSLQGERIAASVARISLDSSANKTDSDLADVFKPHLSVNGMIRVVNKDSNGIITVTNENEMSNNLKPMFSSSQKTEVKSVKGVQHAVTYFPITWHNGDIMTLEVAESLTPVKESMLMLKLFLLAASLIILISLLPFIFNRKNTK